MKLHAAILSNGEVDIGDINLADMDPEDIRVNMIITSLYWLIKMLLMFSFSHFKKTYPKWFSKLKLKWVMKMWRFYMFLLWSKSWQFLEDKIEKENNECHDRYGSEFLFSNFSKQ